jgi:hypothetical protein
MSGIVMRATHFPVEKMLRPILGEIIVFFKCSTGKSMETISMSARIFGRAAVFALALVLDVVDASMGATPTSRGVAVSVSVEAGAHSRRHTPVVFELPEALKDAGAVKLTQLDPERPVDAQVLTVAGKRPQVIFLLDALPAGATRRYRLEAAEPSQDQQRAVTCLDDGGQIQLSVGDRPVLRYHAEVVEAPVEVEPYYRRSGQIHPLFTPSGRIVTDDFPPDHAHQHAVFFAWVNTTFQGRHLDFWNQREQTGRITHAATLGTVSGPVFGQFQVRLRHEDLTAPGGPTPVLDEVWTVRAYNVSDVFLVDFESQQSCASSEPLTINKYHYGGMGLRGNRAWFDAAVKGNDPPDPSRSGASDFLTSEGKNRATGNHTRPTWVDLSGALGDQPGGVALFDHPENFRFPQPVRLHPNKPYFCFAPMVVDAFEIAPGRPYLSRYRFVVHDGPPDRNTLERFGNDYSRPPQVRITEEP